MCPLWKFLWAGRGGRVLYPLHLGALPTSLPTTVYKNHLEKKLYSPTKINSLQKLGSFLLLNVGWWFVCIYLYTYIFFVIHCLYVFATLLFIFRMCYMRMVYSKVPRRIYLFMCIYIYEHTFVYLSLYIYYIYIYILLYIPYIPNILFKKSKLNLLYLHNIYMWFSWLWKSFSYNRTIEKSNKKKFCFYVHYNYLYKKIYTLQ